MKRENKSLAQDLRHAVGRFAPAELGEHLPLPRKPAARPSSVREHDRVLGDGPDPDPCTRSAPRKHVALAVSGRLLPGAVRYALSVCSRLEADLDVLTNRAPAEFADVLQEHCPELKSSSMQWRVVAIGPNAVSGIGRYASETTGLLFIIASAEDAIAELAPGKRHKAAWQEAIPLVVVTEAPRPGRGHL